MLRFSFPVLAIAATGLSMTTATAAERAGQTTRVQAEAYQKSGAYPFNLRRGDEIYRDANVSTRAHGSVAMLFDDGTDMTLGPNTEVVIDEYVYAPGGGGQAAISFGKGVLRLVSGTMPKENVTIDTPVATVGIRGTTFTLAIAEPGTLQGWVERGVVTATSDQTGQTFAFTAPAAFVCSAGGCQATDGQGLPPAAFPPPGPGFGYSGANAGGPDADDHGGGHSD